MSGCANLGTCGGNKTVTVTQTMINNGGFVMVAREASFGQQVRRGEWITLEAPAIVLSRSTALPVTEGSSATYTVKLSVAPTGNVKVRVASNNSEVKVKTGSGTASSTLDLTFSTSTWNDAQTVTVSADSDTDSLPDTARLRHTTVNADTSAEYDGAATVDLTVNVADDDAAMLLSATSLTVTEASGSGRTATFTVKLATQPTANVVIGVSGDDASEGSVLPSQLTFTPSDWSQTQTVTVTAVDDDVDDGNVDWDVTLASPTSTDTNYSGLSSRTVDVSTTDDDTAGITVSAVSGQATEAGGTATFTVKLDSEPTANVTISVTSEDTGEGTVSPSSLTFEPNNANSKIWSSTQTVTVTGADDSMNDGTQTYNITLGAPTSTDTNYSGLSSRTVSVSTTDDDSPAITVSAVSGQATEAGGTATFTVKLATQPTANVTISVTSEDTGEGTVSPSTLTFEPNNANSKIWSSTQTVTVTGVDDNIVDGTQTYNITLGSPTSTDTGYSGLSSQTVSVSTTDDDTVGITVSAVSGQATEAGGTATFTVRLNTQPSANVTISVTSEDTGEGTVSPSSLTFEPNNANSKIWSSTQTVTVTGVDDSIADGTVTYDITLGSPTSTDTDYSGLSSQTVRVSTTDDDSPGITVSAVSGQATEAGGTATFTVRLNTQPSANVTISVTSEDTGEGTVSPSSLTFEPDNTNSKIWSSTQTVTVTGVDDSLDDGTQTYNITLGSPTSTDTGYSGLSSQTVSVSTTDNDSAGITVSAVSGQATEAGGTATFTVKLDSEPSANVTISVTSEDTGEGTVSPSTLTFEPTNANGRIWSSTQTVTVTGVDDSLDDGTQTYNITLGSPTSTDTGYSGLSSQTVSVSTTDNDTAGITVSAVSGQATEAGGTATFTVKLDSEPTANVTISVTSEDTGEGTVSPSSLTFEPTNANGRIWSSAQTVTVTGVDDGLDDGNQTYNITLGSPTSTDTGYSGLSSRTVSVSTTDDDTAGITVSALSGQATESGGTARFTVKLDSEPTANVTISVTSEDTGEGTVSPSSLTFEPDNTNSKIWSSAQTVTVTGADDSLDDGTQTYNITLGSPTSTDTDYSGLSSRTVSASTTDDDAVGITVGAVSGQATEAGGTATFTVKLDSEPTANVTISVTSEDTGEGTVSPSSLTFEPDNTNSKIWSSAQTVTVTGVDDSIADGTVTYDITLGSPTSTDTDYSGLSSRTVSVSTTDNDSPGVVVSQASGTPLAVNEGSSGTYNVRLATQPTGNVTVVITSDNPDVKVKTGSGTAQGSLTLTFEATNANNLIWSADQAVTVEVSADTDSLDETATLTQSIGSGSATEYSSVSVNDVAVSVTDTTDAGLSIADASASEGSGTLDFTVTLSMASSRTVTVDWTLAAGTATAGTQPGGDYDDSTNSGTLTFSSGGSLTQTISVPIVDDPVVEEDETVTVTLSNANNADISDGSATGTIREDDVAGVRVTPERSQRTTTEDDAGTVDLMVSLSSRPSAAVTVTVTSADTTEGRVKESEEDDDPTLDFTTGNWDTAQTVTVTGVDDEDLDGDMEYNVRFAFSSTDTNYNGIDPVDVALTNLDDDLSILSVSGGGEVAEGDSGTTARATFTVTLSPARRQAVSVSYATSDGTAEAGSDYESASGTVTFSPGETSKTVTVTINGDDEAEANETFTLALTSTPNGQIDPQNSSAGAVIKNDDEKMVDAGMSGEFSVGETTVTVDSTLADDTGLEVVLPSELESGGTAIDELTVTLGPTEREIDGDLFGYTGSGEDHVLVDIDVSPVPDDAVRVCLPITEGLRRAAGSQRLYLIRFSGGRWEELSSETEDDMVCADVRGFSPFAVVFEIDYAKRRVGEVNRAILPELARAMTASTLEAITSRIDDAMAGGGTAGAFGAPSPPEPELGWAEPELRLGEFEDGEELSLTEAADGSYFSVSLAGGYDPLREEEESEAEQTPAPSSGGLGMWISGDYRNLSGKGGGLVDWDGRVISGHLGADYRFGRSFLAGVATSWSQGSFDYTGRGEGSARVSGDYGSRMNSFHPYLGLSLSERLGLWAAGGWGFGEIRMDDGEITGRQRASTRLGTLAAGADLTLLGGDASSLSLKGEAWISRVKVKDNGGRIEGLRVKTNRLRAALEGSHALAFGSGSSLVPSLEFAIRRDGGDGETGVGGELGGGISLVSSTGLTVEARGRGLLFHQGDAKEWGVGGSVRFDPGGDERGLSMSVIPSWGNSASGVQSLWESEGAEVGSADSERSLSLETEVGYGFAALGDRGLLTPYGAFARAGGDGRSYRAGSRLSMGGKFDVSLEGLRTETGAGDPEHGITLQGRLNW